MRRRRGVVIACIASAGGCLREPLVDEDLGVRGMIDDHQRHVIDEVGLPQLRGDAHVVRAVLAAQLIAADLHPVFRLRHAGRVLRVDAQTERRPPQEVGHEAHPGAVVGEHPRARALQPLLGDNRFVGAAVEIGLHDAVRPDDPRDVDAGARAQAEVHGRSGDHLLLRQQAGSDFDVAADAERVDALIAGGRLRARANDLPVIAPCRLPKPAGRSAVARPTRSSRPSPLRSTTVTIGRRAARPAAEKSPVAARKPDPRASCAGRDEIERAVVVEIGEKQPIRAGHRRRLGDRTRSPASVAPSRRGRVTRAGSTPVASSVTTSSTPSPLTSPRVNATTPSGRPARSSPRTRRLTVLEHMQTARRVEQRGVRIAVAVEIAPRKRPQADDAGERLQRLPGAVAVVAQHQRAGRR